MYCPQCSQSLEGLPDVDRCPKCDFVYMNGVTTNNAPKNQLLRATLVSWAVVIVVILFLLVGIIPALQTLFGDPHKYDGSSNDPLVNRFNAIVDLLLAIGIIIAVVVWPFFSRSIPFWIHSGGIGWRIRGSLKKFIPWEIIEDVIVTPDHKNVVLILTIGGQEMIRRKSYRKEHTAQELYEIIKKHTYKDVSPV